MSKCIFCYIHTSKISVMSMGLQFIYLYHDSVKITLGIHFGLEMTQVTVTEHKTCQTDHYLV